MDKIAQSPVSKQFTFLKSLTPVCPPLPPPPTLLHIHTLPSLFIFPGQAVPDIFLSLTHSLSILYLYDRSILRIKMDIV